MALAVLLLATAALIAFVSLLYIPLPDGICDRFKLQFIEFLLRISNEYIGAVAQILFGSKVYNRLTRFFVAIPFAYPVRTPKWITVKNERVGSTKVRVYYPEKRDSNALIIFIHGGGWAVMNTGYYDNLLYHLIARLSVVVISVDYQLSPESPFPGPVLECETVFQTIVNGEYQRFGIDPTRICVMGDSAGGNLSAVLAQRQLRQKLPMPKVCLAFGVCISVLDGKQKENKKQCQVLFYPVIHAFDLQSPSYQLFYKELCGTSLLNPRLMARWYLLYLDIPATSANINRFLRNCHLRKNAKDTLRKTIGHDLLPKKVFEDPFFDGYVDCKSDRMIALRSKDKDSSEDEELCQLFEQHGGFDPDFAPIMGENLEGLPRALIVTAGYDILRDEGIMYAKRLQSFKVAVEWKHYPAAYHGVLNMPSSSQRLQILDDTIAYLNANL